MAAHSRGVMVNSVSFGVFFDLMVAFIASAMRSGLEAMTKLNGVTKLS